MAQDCLHGTDRILDFFLHIPSFNLYCVPSNKPAITRGLQHYNSSLKEGVEESVEFVQQCMGIFFSLKPSLKNRHVHIVY